MNELNKLTPYYHLTMEQAQKNREVGKMIEQVEMMNEEDFQKGKRRLARPSYLEPGTVGAYLFGCDFEHYGDIGKNCSLLCLQSKSELKEEVCQSQVWSLQNNELKQIEAYPGTHAIVYLLDETPFQGFEGGQLHELSAKGVEHVTLVEIIFGRHRIIYEKESLTEIPTILDVKEGIPVITYKDLEETKTYLPFILIAILFCICLYFFSRS